MKTKTYFGGSNIALLAEANKKAGLQCIGCLQYKKDMKSSLVILNNEGELKRSSINTALRKMCEQIIKKLKL